ncbi:MAG: recombination protein RecT [Duodenibacillus sp.]|nr:recombination protein RecT [Duodenibacillus sp.]
MSTTDALRSQIAPAAQSRAVAQTAKPNTLLGMILAPGFQKQMKLALPKALTPERLTRIVMTECRKTPQLLKCNQESFMGAVLQCAQLGLEPGSALGHCYLLPFGNGKAKDGKPNAQLIIGYRGMIDLARRSGQILSINAYVVHEQDDFSYELGLHPDIKHVPAASADPGKVTFVYAVANLKGGGTQFEVMSRAEIEAVRKTSKAGTSGPWANHWDEMAKKTTIRRLFKYLPVSIEAAKAVEVDEKTDRGEAITETDVLEGEYIEKGGEMPFEEPQAPAEEEQPQPEVIEPAQGN